MHTYGHDRPFSIIQVTIPFDFVTIPFDFQQLIVHGKNKKLHEKLNDLKMFWVEETVPCSYSLRKNTIQ